MSGLSMHYEGLKLKNPITKTDYFSYCLQSSGSSYGISKKYIKVFKRIKNTVRVPIIAKSSKLFNNIPWLVNQLRNKLQDGSRQSKRTGSVRHRGKNSESECEEVLRSLKFITA